MWQVISTTVIHLTHMYTYMPTHTYTGSKTVQLLESITGNGNRAGLVVANDVNRDRAYLLAHQCKRVEASCLTVTWCAAQVSQLYMYVYIHIDNE